MERSTQLVREEAKMRDLTSVRVGRSLVLIGGDRPRDRVIEVTVRRETPC
jgi:hypothetical protein